eukprot:TRINITY_DN2406_c6_g1_i1.p1 TRINITY_DN2406_c6_g1~~TRINITY_DN2406_c6_g1_i1.p1  ORF type:complete len:214 (+),score=76.73 TRINITY_DN2406_c6_g1_i1:29-643(+)
MDPTPCHHNGLTGAQLAALCRAPRAGPYVPLDPPGVTQVMEDPRSEAAAAAAADAIVAAATAGGRAPAAATTVRVSGSAPAVAEDPKRAAIRAFAKAHNLSPNVTAAMLAAPDAATLVIAEADVLHGGLHRAHTPDSAMMAELRRMKKRLLLKEEVAAVRRDPCRDGSQVSGRTAYEQFRARHSRIFTAEHRHGMEGAPRERDY